MAQVELVHVRTADGLGLDGALRLPEATGSTLPIDGCIMVHGRGGNFYGPGLFDDFGDGLLDRGCAVMRINTRGSGEVGLARTETGRLLIGSACEVVGQCREDLDTWIGAIAERGYKRIGLWGHSLGALKAIYYQARTHDPRVTCMVAGSPPWLAYEHFMAQPEGPEIAAAYKKAKDLINAGRGTEIFQVAAPLRGTLSTASQYVEKYGPEDNYNILNDLPNVTCPTLVTLGTEEAKTMAAFRGLYEKVKALSNRQKNLDVVLIQGADHGYTGVREETWSHIQEWFEAF